MADIPPIQLDQSGDLPSELAYLLPDYPRAQWSTHPSTGFLARHWLGVHASLRAAANRLRDIALTADNQALP